MPSGNNVKWSRWLLAGGLALAAGGTFYTLRIVPLQEQERNVQQSIAELKEQIAEARGKVEEIRAAERQMGSESSELKSLDREIPEGPAVVWVPALIKEHFARFGVGVATVRLNTILEEPRIPGYSRGYWSVSLPIDKEARDVRGLLLALAEIESQNSFIQVLEVSIQPDHEDPLRRIAALNIAVLIQQ